MIPSKFIYHKATSVKDAIATIGNPEDIDGARQSLVTQTGTVTAEAAAQQSWP